ncbi:MAG: hypothetical protein GY822_10330, partial [Deltaproteobacteria bacterium]|nr:hypothetical protein [Deltaproteobacteria bacterium]
MLHRLLDVFFKTLDTVDAARDRLDRVLGKEPRADPWEVKWPDEENADLDDEAKEEAESAPEKETPSAKPSSVKKATAKKATAKKATASAKPLSAKKATASAKPPSGKKATASTKPPSGKKA